MKIIIAGPDAEHVREIVEKQRHAVVAETVNLKLLVQLILRHTPHVVIITNPRGAEDLIAELTNLCITVRFVLLDPRNPTASAKAIRQALRQGRINVPWYPGTPDGRTIVIDPDYKPYAAPQKLKRPVTSPTWDADAASQLLRLIWMMRTARVQRERANRYREAFTKIGGYEWQEAIYRTVHGSFKAPAYALQQLARYQAYLAHFVPSVDLDALPAPIDEPADFRYVHYHPPLETHYALFALGLFGFNSALSTQFYEVLDWRFQGQSEEELSRQTIKITGLAFTVMVIGYAQATVIDWLLDPQVLRKINDPRPRHLHRSLQTFTDFWELRHVMEDNKLLAVAIDDSQNNPDQSLPDELLIPNFSEFHRAITASTPTQK